MTCGVNFRPSGSSPSRCSSRSCSACNSISGATGVAAATNARGLRPPNDDSPSSRSSNGAPLHAPEQAGNIARERVVDVADEAQREMIIFRIDPARARQTAAHHGERLADVTRNFKTL